jgi:hypothetical protein
MHFYTKFMQAWLLIIWGLVVLFGIANGTAAAVDMIGGYDWGYTWTAVIANYAAAAVSIAFGFLVMKVLSTGR